MPKVGKNSKLQRAARRAAASAPLPLLPEKNKREEEKDHEPETPDPQKLSRGQRKRQAKREQYLRKERMILSSLKLKSQEEQKKRIDGLDAIKEALMNTTKEGKVEEAPSQTYKTNKSKRRLLAQEVQHLGLVLQHPAFKADPFAAIQEHLKNTFADQTVISEAEAKQQNQASAKKKEERKRLKKERIDQGLIKKKSKKKYKATRSR